jgi:putative transposase
MNLPPFSPYERVSHARESLARFIAFYNTRRPSLDGKTPHEVYFAAQADARLAA